MPKYLIVSTLLLIVRLHCKVDLHVGLWAFILKILDVLIDFEKVRQQFYYNLNGFIIFRLILSTNKSDVNISKSTHSKLESKGSQTVSAKTDKTIGNKSLKILKQIDGINV